MSVLRSKIESILFVSGDPISTKRMSGILGVEEKELQKEIDILKEDYKEKGVSVLQKDSKVQMVSSPDNADVVSALVESSLSEELTPAALETLAVICYREPISRRDIDEIRGVNSVFSLRTLLMRGLVEKSQKKGEEEDVFYKTSLDFLKKLGISNVSELPEYEKLSKEQNLEK